MSLLNTPTKDNNIRLKGAIQISNNSFFVYANEKGHVFIKNGKEEKIHKNAIKYMLQSNPLIKELLKNYKIKLSIDTSILKELTNGHMNETCKIVAGIYEFLPEDLKNKINSNVVKEAAMLHDLGKILIPPKILNKPSKLNIKEREIMNTHSILGYELLKTQSISKETLELIKFHHQNLNNSGYPAVLDGENPSYLGVQLISISDKYSALREKRVYRKRLSRIEALVILYKEVREGKILPEVYKALVKYAREYDN